MEDNTEIPDNTKPTLFGSLDLSLFAYSPASMSGSRPTPPNPRRSPRKHSTVTTQSEPEESLQLPISFSGSVVNPTLKRRRRRNAMSDEGASSTGASSKKLKRSYATPETYSHLSGLQDYLGHDLDGGYR